MKRIILIVAGVLVVLAGVVWFFLRARPGGNAQTVLKVNSVPTATIFLNNENIGKTPYEEQVKPGEYTLKLVPESTVGTIVSWEGRITLRPNLLTYINRELKDSELTSSGEVISLEQIGGKNAEISVVTAPDGANVTIDNQGKGNAPLIIKDLADGNYELGVSLTGYAPRSVKIKTTAGFKLNAVFNLGALNEPQPTPVPTLAPSPETSPKTSPKATPAATPKTSPAVTSKPKASPPAKPYVEIQETPTGFLRVRSEAGTSGDEVGRVNPGEFYKLLDEETVSGTAWYQIEYETGKQGWVSSQYAKKSS